MAELNNKDFANYLQRDHNKHILTEFDKEFNLKYFGENKNINAYTIIATQPTLKTFKCFIIDAFLSDIMLQLLSLFDILSIYLGIVKERKAFFIISMLLMLPLFIMLLIKGYSFAKNRNMFVKHESSYVSGEHLETKYNSTTNSYETKTVKEYSGGNYSCLANIFIMHFFAFLIIIGGVFIFIYEICAYKKTESQCDKKMIDIFNELLKKYKSNWFNYKKFEEILVRNSFTNEQELETENKKLSYLPMRERKIKINEIKRKHQNFKIEFKFNGKTYYTYALKKAYFEDENCKNNRSTFNLWLCSNYDSATNKENFFILVQTNDYSSIALIK